MEPGLNDTSSDHAAELDRQDPLASYRDRFIIPQHPQKGPIRYFCGNSLGLQPKGARDLITQELDDWGDLAVDAHFSGKTPWYSYHEVFSDTCARVVGARPGEVVMMNSLTVNLHLMMVSFYRPTRERNKILVESPLFPSDHFAVESQIRFHGRDPKDTMISIGPRSGEHTIRTADLEAVIDERGEEITLVMLGGVNFFTGQCFDLERITRAAHAKGCAVGFDLAHAAGNVELRLHDWDADFAVWCSYKYLNGSPGAIAGCFVHERHAAAADLPRFAGWWGNEPETRFRMHLHSGFVPKPTAEGWQLSNPPILAMAPLRSSMELFDEVGMPRLREKSLRLTGYLETLLDGLCPKVEILTPRDPRQRGCQLSLRFQGDARRVMEALQREACVCDFRPPDVIRVAPVPLYNTYSDVWDLVDVLRKTQESA